MLLISLAAPVYAQQENGSAGNAAGSQAQVNQADTNVPGQGFDDRDFGPQVEEESVIWMIFKTIIVLALFIGGFYLFYKFVTQKAGLQVTGHEAIQVLSMIPVGPNRSLQLVEVAGRVYLIGVSEAGINMLTEINNKEEIDRIRLLSSRSTPVKDLTFQDFITDQIGRVVERIHDVKDKISEKRTHGGGKTSVTEISDKEFDMSYLNKQKSRLRNINEDDKE